jgi:hypothetical protein
MAYVGSGRYVVLVLHVGGTKLSNVKLMLQRELRTGKTWFPVGSQSQLTKSLLMLPFASYTRKLVLL